ncbi:hypothetical protein TSAR_015869, partial [Trichomalopsis sarcophagae]
MEARLVKESDANREKTCPSFIHCMINENFHVVFCIKANVNHTICSVHLDSKVRCINARAVEPPRATARQIYPSKQQKSFDISRHSIKTLVSHSGKSSKEPGHAGRSRSSSQSHRRRAEPVSSVCMRTKRRKLKELRQGRKSSGCFEAEGLSFAGQKQLADLPRLDACYELIKMIAGAGV